MADLIFQPFDVQQEELKPLDGAQPRPHLHECSLSGGPRAARPAETGNNRGGSPVALVRHWLPSRSWRGARRARLCARTFSL